MIDRRISDKLGGLFSQKSAWFGTRPQISADAIQPDPEKNYRLAPELHGRYKVVWLYEHNLYDMAYWPLILDEALRLLGDSGKLVLRTFDDERGTTLGSLCEVKSCIFRHHAREATLDWQDKIDGEHVVSIMDIKRLDYAMYTSDRWSVGILGNGARNKNIVNLINRLNELADGMDLEFIVAGPFQPSWVTCPDLVRVIGDDDWDDLPRVGKKKYLLGRAANHENVALFHDRYQVHDNFFAGFRDFGYDFDFVTINQFFADGKIFPAYVGARNRLLRWCVIGHHKSAGVLFEGHFINGGLMIFKKNTLQNMNFNPLLLHNEAEDQEISYLLRDVGVIPRINIFSSAVTVGITVPSYYAKSVPFLTKKIPVKNLPLVKRIADRFPRLKKRLRDTVLYRFAVKMLW